MNQLKTQIKDGNLKNFESIQAGKALIASLKEYCFRIITGNTLDLSEISNLKSGLRHAFNSMLNQCQKNHDNSKKWIIECITKLEIMKYKTEDAQMSL